MPKYRFSIVREAARIIELPQDVELLTKDGKLRTNKIALEVASPVIHKAIMENNATAFDLKNYSQESVVGLLDMIYLNHFTVTDENIMNEVTSLARDLEIKFQLDQAFTEDDNIKVAAPKVPEEPQENDDDPGLFKMDDGTGRFGCGICFKSFGSKPAGTTHYQDVHMTDKSQRNFKCRAPNCNKTFAVERYMKDHMKRRHGISAKMLKSKKSVKVPKKGMRQEEPVEL